MPKYLGYVRCWVNSGKHVLAWSFSGFDPSQTLMGAPGALHREPLWLSGKPTVRYHLWGPRVHLGSVNQTVKLDNLVIWEEYKDASFDIDGGSAVCCALD
jgi:hypothetical protein